MDLFHLGVAVVMALATYGLLKLCEELSHNKQGERP
jgi:hypothetical protein